MTSLGPENQLLGLGGFRLDDMELALPLTALREVQPFKQLSPLPCPNKAVVGGLNLRGVVIPVLDLRTMLGKQAEALFQPSVVIMVHEGHVLGLLSNGVSGVFEVPADSVKPMTSAEGVIPP